MHGNKSISDTYRLADPPSISASLGPAEQCHLQVPSSRCTSAVESQLGPVLHPLLTEVSSAVLRVPQCDPAIPRHSVYPFHSSELTKYSIFVGLSSKGLSDSLPEIRTHEQRRILTGLDNVCLLQPLPIAK